MAQAFFTTTDRNAEEPFDETGLENLNLLEGEISSVAIIPAPSFVAYHKESDKSVEVTCDTAATSSLVSYELASRLGLKIERTSQVAHQADHSRLKVRGEVHFHLVRGPLRLSVNALVIDDLNCQILGGTPFLKENSIVIDLPNNKIIIQGKHRISTGGIGCQPRNIYAYLVRAGHDQVICPGDEIELETPFLSVGQQVFAFEPKNQSDGEIWTSPVIINAENGRFSVRNDSNNIISINRNQHLATIRTVCQPSDTETDTAIIPVPPQPIDTNTGITVDPSQEWSPKVGQKFRDTPTDCPLVFSESIGKYNDFSGRVRAHITIGETKPPKCKAFLPNYDTSKMQRMQSIMDDLEREGVLAKPEDHGIVVEQISPSFLIPKQDPNDFRLVTSFVRLAEFVKPPPSRVTSTDDVLIFLAKWKHVIKTDMSKQFYQLPLTKESMKYVGVMTPYKGMRVYCRAAMGMPGSTENLDELMSRVLGAHLHNGTVAKFCDDIYVGGNSAEELLMNWLALLRTFSKNNLRLSASKTVVNPKEAVILGWLWKEGTISPSPHRLSSLSRAEPPRTIKGLRAWLGGVKHLRQCVPNLATAISPLEEFVGNKDSGELVSWNDELLSAYCEAQKLLVKTKTVVVPRPSDQLVIVTDGAIKARGIGATLYVRRNGKTLLGVFFSAKLPVYQNRWLPCEIEGLAISAAVKFWNKLIRESKHPTQVLTDSKPCIEAYAKLSRGEFSSRARICAFLSTLADRKLILAHISGKANETSDYQSRNPIICEHDNCQMCQFVSEQHSISSVTATDILERRSPVPFLSPQAWRECQQECPDLRKVYGFKRNGTGPNRKSRVPTNVKRYLQHASMGTGQLRDIVVVKRTQPFMPIAELIVVPVSVVEGLLTALHIKLQHPTRNQLRKVFDRSFFALNLDSYLDKVTRNCTHCTALMTLPKEAPSFTTSVPPEHPGSRFSADVLRRSSQMIFVLRDNFSSYTNACLIPSEKHEDLREGILRTSIGIKMSEEVGIRVDPAPGFKALKNDPVLRENGIIIEIGDPLNVNKNPVAEKCIGELERELKIVFPRAEKVSESDLQKILKVLNSRIRSRNLSAHEIMFQRDQFGKQMPINDAGLKRAQFAQRRSNHDFSSRTKVPFGQPTSVCHPKPGDLVLLKCEGTKHAGREQHIVIAVSPTLVQLRKFCGNQFRSKIVNAKPNQIYPLPRESRDKKHDSSIQTVQTSSDSDEDSDYDKVVFKKTDKMRKNVQLQTDNVEKAEHQDDVIEISSENESEIDFSELEDYDDDRDDGQNSELPSDEILGATAPIAPILDDKTTKRRRLKPARFRDENFVYD